MVLNRLVAAILLATTIGACTSRQSPPSALSTPLTQQTSTTNTVSETQTTIGSSTETTQSTPTETTTPHITTTSDPDVRVDTDNITWCADAISNPTRLMPCAIAYSLGTWAEQASTDWFQTTGDRNAFRHCLWAATMTRHLGENGDNGARGFLDRREGSQVETVDQTLTDSGTDRHNNEIGIAIGHTLTGPDQTIKDQAIARCIDAINDGRLLR